MTAREPHATPGFVDVHSHILYGLDDGATSREESVAMLQCARRNGTVAIVATPHANARYRFDAALVAERLADLQGTAGIRIYPGCDFHLQYNNIEAAVANPGAFAINHGVYLLVEFSDAGTLHAAERMLGRLLDAGLVPVITHPERNAQIQRRIDEVASWVSSGCCVQLTAASFTGGFGPVAQACAETLLTRGLAHVVASDAHDCRNRTPDLADAYARLADDHGEEFVRPLFVDNPTAMVAGEALLYEPMFSPPVRARKWYQFWA